jgi:SAM-dependent methyltransferase
MRTDSSGGDDLAPPVAGQSVAATSRSSVAPPGRVERFGVELDYGCLPGALSQGAASRFVQLSLDLEGEAFLNWCLSRRYSRLKLWIKLGLRWFISDFDLNALLRLHRVFLLSAPQLQQLLGGQATHRWLDVGAGNGDLASTLLPFTENLLCTEVSRASVWRLRRRRLPCELLDAATSKGLSRLTSAGPFDVISLFNVLDRCARPRTLLKNLVQLLDSQGRLLLSVPLPMDAFYYWGGASLMPQERFTLSPDSFEQALSDLIATELAPLGLSVRACARVPYLSSGDVDCPLYGLDSALVLCEKV